MSGGRPPNDFVALSARLGADPLRIQGPGGNTSWKAEDGTLWIKASGFELAHAAERDVFVPVDRAAALAEARGAGDGTCRAAVIGDTDLRPSIETTFHALLDARVVAHTHSVAALVHAICAAGRAEAMRRLAGLDAILVPYAMPGLPLTRAIAAAWRPGTRVAVLANHGLIVAGEDAAEVGALSEEVEGRLEVAPRMPARPVGPPPAGHRWHEGAAGLAVDPRPFGIATRGSYWPDHVVFLGPALPDGPCDGRPAALIAGRGAALREDATPAQAAMLTCLWDVLARLPADWTPEPIGPDAEAALMGWDAEAYRQKLAGRTAP